MVTVSRVAVPVAGTAAAESTSTIRLEVRGESQAILALPSDGTAGFAAVSVETDGGGIGVAESIVGGSTVGGPVVLSSPCAVGAATRGYVPTGSTYHRSDVRLSLYDPDATPAVVDVSVSTGTGLTSPAAFQGVVVPATGLVVLDLRRWVPQISTLAVTAAAVSGDIVVGALESTSETLVGAPGHGSTRRSPHVHVTGSSLLVGPEHGLGRWAFAAGPSTRGVVSTFSVYDPGTRPVLVSVAPPGQAGEAAALTADVPAGGIVDFATPIDPGGGTGPGSVVISAHGQASIVAARLTTRPSSPGLEELDVTAGTAGPGDEWLLPGAAFGPRVGDAVTLANPGTRGATVTLFELSSGAAAKVRLDTVTLPAGSEVAVDLGSSVAGAAAFAIGVSATDPILVEQALVLRQGLTTAVGGIPVLR